MRGDSSVCGEWNHVVFLYVDTDVSEEYAASIFRPKPPKKCQYPPTRPYNVIMQKTTIWMFQIKFLNCFNLFVYSKSTLQ
jgi:hypothetical protein